MIERLARQGRAEQGRAGQGRAGPGRVTGRQATGRLTGPAGLLALCFARQKL